MQFINTIFPSSNQHEVSQDTICIFHIPLGLSVCAKFGLSLYTPSTSTELEDFLQWDELTKSVNGKTFTVMTGKSMNHMNHFKYKTNLFVNHQACVNTGVRINHFLFPIIILMTCQPQHFQVLMAKNLVSVLHFKQ